MNRTLPFLTSVVLIWGGVQTAAAQLTPEEIAARPRWERFLLSARLVDASRPFTKREAVTEPYVLTLEEGGITRRAIWKNVDERFKIADSWRYEIAAYRLDKLLELNMICPTVERRFMEERGSCQLMAENVTQYRDMAESHVELPAGKNESYFRMVFLQRAFDNLIGNIDRNPGDILLTEDFRWILCDHSRAFRTSGRYAEQLIFDENSEGGPKPMERLPRAFVDKLRILDFESVRAAVEDYLTEEEIRKMLIRRDLILEWIDARIKRLGEDQVLYE